MIEKKGRDDSLCYLTDNFHFSGGRLNPKMFLPPFGKRKNSSFNAQKFILKRLTVYDSIRERRYEEHTLAASLILFTRNSLSFCEIISWPQELLFNYSLATVMSEGGPVELRGCNQSKTHLKNAWALKKKYFRNKKHTIKN